MIAWPRTPSRRLQRPPDVAPRLPNDPDEASQMRQRLDVGRFAGVDRPDGDPGDRPAEADARRDHLDLEFEAGFVAVERHFHHPPADEAIARLVVRDPPPDGPRERPPAEFV